MKKFITKTFQPLALLGLIALITVGCDRDYLNIESDISGVQNFSANRKVFPFVSYTKKPNPIQTNGLPNNLLGVYNDGSQPYGTTEASIITQVLPTNLSPDFGVNPTLQSVKLYIPYYSEVESTDEEGISTYKLDSVFGNQNESFKLSIYRSNYLLRDLDPATDFEDQQLYYSNIFETIDINSQTLELLYENDNFEISNSTHQVTDEDGETEYLAPGIRVDLFNEDNTNIINLSDWENLFFPYQDNEELTNNSSFYNYFRGLIFKVEDNSGGGSMAMLNLSDSNATITLEYTYYDEDDTDQEQELTGEYSLNFTGIKANNFENLYTPPTDGDSSLGDDNLYIKGMDGNFSVIKLFDGTTQDEDGNNVPALEYFKDQEGNWLINEANLTFYVNKPLTNNNGTTDEPERLILFDIKNNTPIVDYYFDGTDNGVDPIFSKVIHARPLELDENQVGERYKFRITEHVKNILLRDSTNVELGLYVSTNVNNISTSKISNTTDEEDINFIPLSSVISPKGTVLYGSKESVPEENRATFEIYYTEPEN
ncbi:MAG TPA: DUF4270 domain-containing protein [Flavobacteriaceae bacterium]|nr:DUF4270 domain-containing protein [Flavobacteriaceae bacterium]